MENEEAKTDRAADERWDPPSLPEREPGKSGGGGRMQWSFIVAGAFVLSLVAFISGVRMGKGLSDFKHTGAPSVKAQAKGPKSSPFRVEVKGPELQAGKETRSPAAQAPPSSQAQEKLLGEKVAPPSEKAIPQTSTATKKAPPPKAQFALQVAALSNPEEARDLVKQLRSKGYEAYQVTGTAAAKGTLYRVRIGQFQSLAEARQFALAFEKKEKIKTIIASLQ
jgi:cell division septation protein DedD